MNIPMLKKVRAAILKRPRQFEMTSFFSKSLVFHDEWGIVKRTAEPSHCGTAACIAGWAIHIKYANRTTEQTANQCKPMANVNDYDFYDAEGEKALEISNDQSRRLFYVTSWPGKFETSYRRADSATARAKVAAARINHFIKTKGRE